MNIKISVQTIFLYAFAFLGGAVGVLAFSPFDFPIFAYVSLFVLLWTACLPRKKNALWGSFSWGMGFFAIGISWLHVSIHQFGGASLILSYIMVILFATYLAMYPTLFAYLVQRFHIQSPAVFPVLWTLVELVRANLLSGFPWLQFGYTQIDTPFFGLAPLFGVQGLTFFTMWVASVFFDLYRRLRQGEKKWSIIGLELALLGGMMGLAYASSHIPFVHSKAEKPLTFTLLQGNIAQQIKWDPAYVGHSLHTYEKLIQQHMGKSDVIILPEAALPLTESELASFLHALNQQALANQTEVVIGAISQPNSKGMMNTIIDLGNPYAPYTRDNQNRYHKHHLVPFGEYVPFASLLRPLGSIFNLPMSQFQAGEAKQTNLNIRQRQFSPAICYEIIFGEQLRQNTRQQTDYLLTLSNDAWFGHSIGPWQHLQMARMRALELGRPLIRATNNGITAFIDEKGQLLKTAPQFIETDLTMALHTTTGRTPYAVLGNFPLYVLMVMLLLIHASVEGIRSVLAKRIEKATYIGKC